MLTRMPLRVLTAGGVGVLLGIGLCGLDTLMPDHRQEFGGTAAFIGFVVLLASFATLVIGGIWLVVAKVIDSELFKRDRR